MDDILYQDSELVQFYDYDNPWFESFDVITNLVNETDTALDIGCGTGTLLNYIGKKCKSAYGLDLSAEMLAVAMKKSSTVEWVHVNATNFAINQKFDLIFLSGHSFQTLLDDRGRSALLERVKVHLAPAGKLVFDSRNPLVEEWKSWTPKNSVRYFQHPNFGIIKAWNDYHSVADLICYQTYYQILNTDKIWKADSTISFPSFEQVSLLIAQSGLALTDVYGDWYFNDFTSDSEEMIFSCSLM
jgi:SAM-dependent methyltransferase